MSLWNPWVTERSTILVQNEDDTFANIERPDIPFPYIYTPARAFWLRSLIKNCSIPWRHPGDLFNSFLMAGGSSPNLIGAMSGLSVIASEPDWFKSKTFGYGYSYPFPQVGYCLGDQFKQQVYVKFDVANTLVGVESLRLPAVELLQNSELKRIYVDHGTVSNYRVVTAEDGTTKNILTLDIEQGASPNIDIFPTGLFLTIIGNVAAEFITSTVDVLEILPNWDLVIGGWQEGQSPQAGDFYELDNTLCVEDPFLMSGIWYGTDNQSRAVVTEKVSSGKNLYWTSHQSPYEEGQIIGIYTWQNIEDGTLALPSTGMSMKDAGGLEWRWYVFDWAAAPDDYNDKRYKEIINEPTSATNAIPTTTTIDGTTTTTTTTTTTQFGSFYGATAGWEERTNATLENVNIMFELEGIEHIRIEISTGGSVFRHNWFAPCLRGQYLKVEGKYYEILDHIEANIIDVKLRSVDGYYLLYPTTIVNYSVLNHKSWQIVEDYSLATAGDVTEGVFSGTISALSYNTESSISSFALEDVTDNFATFTSFNDLFNPSEVDDTITENNFAQRYKKTHSVLGMGEPIKLYNKYQNWKFVIDNVEVTNEEGDVSKVSNEYSITSIAFPPEDPDLPDAPYNIAISVRGNLTDSGLEGVKGYIAFDHTYPTVESAPKQTGFSFDLDINFSGGSGISFLQSNGNLCLNGEYKANPYYVDIPKDTMIGFCEGTYFGFSTQGTNFFSNLMFLITTLRRPRGIASLFQALRQDNWVVYLDQISQQITVRRGSSDFKEYPMKNEIVIGKPESTVDGPSGTTIPLDSSKERLRRLQLKLPDGSNSDPSIMFGIGIANNRYGCAIAGDGLVDLQTLRRQGIGEGETSIEQYKWGDYFVSPVYLYKKGGFQNLDELHADIGIDVSEGPVHIINGSVGGSKIQYVTNKQTLSGASHGDVGYFDFVELWDGEHILVYGQDIRPFNLDGTLNNSSLNSSEWEVPRAVMIIGTWDDAYSWGCPLHKGWENDEKYQYPLMLLNGVEYLSTIYNPLNKTLAIFCKCKDENNNLYVGCLIISLLSFLYDVHLCNDAEPDNVDAQLNFLWRPPLGIDNGWSQETVGGLVSPSEITVIKDQFNKILGPQGSGSQVIYDQEVNIVSTHILPDGTYILFYDSEEGTKAITSSDSGRRWVGTNVILGREGSSATKIDEYLFYITPSGIEIKHTNEIDFYDLRELGSKIAAGENAGDLEERIQARFDATTHFLIGSGSISIQRLSGYMTMDSSKKIFYYNSNNLLSCMESRDTFIWNPSDNF